MPAHWRGDARAGGRWGWGRGGRAMLKSCSWVEESMERARPPQHHSELPKEPHVPALPSGLVANLREQLTPFPKSSGRLFRTLPPTVRAPSLGRISERCSPRLFLRLRKPDGLPSYLKRRKNSLNFCSPQEDVHLQYKVRLLLKQGPAVKQLKFSSGVFYFLSTPWPVVSVNGGGLPFSLSKNEPFLQGVLWLEMVLHAQKAAADAGNPERLETRA